MEYYKETERRFMVGVIWQGTYAPIEAEVIFSTNEHITLKSTKCDRLYTYTKTFLDKYFICPSEEFYFNGCPNKDCFCGNVISKLGTNALNTEWERCEVCNENG